MSRAITPAVLVALALAACAPRTPPMATAGDAERAHVELAELEHGRSLLVQKCGNACHTTPMPSQHTALEWPHMLDEMSQRAGLDHQQRHLIEKYLITMARK